MLGIKPEALEFYLNNLKQEEIMLNFSTNDNRPKEGVALIDFSQISLATALMNFEPKQPIQLGMLRHLVLNTIKQNLNTFKKQGYSEFIICVDNSTDGYWRKDIGYYYKQHRKIDRDESDWDFEGYFNNIHIIVDELKQNMPYKIIDINRIEADDIIAVLTKKFCLESIPVMIVSSDGDFTQLHKYGAKQYSPAQKKAVKPKHGSPQADLMYKLLKGDKKDTVAPFNMRSDFHITKLDGERAKSIATKFVEKCIDATEEELHELLLEKQEGIDQLARFKENQKLIDFDYIPEYIQNQILDSYTEANMQPKSKIYPYFVRSQLTQLMKDISMF